MRGPIDYVVIKFEGHNFNGNVLSALEESVKDGVIAVLSASLIYKSKEGEVMGMEATAGDDKVMALLGHKGAEGNLIDEEDVEEIADLLEPDTSAGLLIIEHLWAKGLKKAIIDAGGELLAEGRIHPEAYAEINKEVEV